MNDKIIRADMPEDVLDGRLGELSLSRLGRFPLAYSWCALVTAAGALVPRGSSAIRTNLYCCLVGPPGSGKTQSNENVFQLLDMWPQHPVLIKGKYGSAEGLVERLQDVEPNASRLIAVDELGHLMTKAAIERSSFPFILNSAYYEDAHSGGSKGHQYQLDCRLSITGGLVEDAFGDAFGLATMGGLYDRFIFGLCPNPHEFLYRPFEGSHESLNPFPALVHSEIWEARDQWIKDGISPRVAEHALRVAYICACVDGRPSLRADQLGPALALAKYQTKVRVVLAPNPGENPDARCAIAVRGWLNENAAGGRLVRRRDLSKGIHYERYGPGVFNRCLNNLMFNGEIELGPNGKTVRLVCAEETEA